MTSYFESQFNFSSPKHGWQDKPRPHADFIESAVIRWTKLLGLKPVLYCRTASWQSPIT